jgi:hypothetical protein
MDAPSASTADRRMPLTIQILSKISLPVVTWLTIPQPSFREVAE